jgi:FkbM family methyltransferase
VHCIEPSPISYDRVRTAVEELPDTVQGCIHLHNVAIGDRDDITVPFISSGTTGDHVGMVDMFGMWKMESIPDDGLDTKGSIINVPSRRLDTLLHDDIINNDDTILYLLKIDTQGYEPALFAGIDALLSTNRVRFILTEFWPKGMDVIAGMPERTCLGVTAILQKLVHHGCRLHVLVAAKHIGMHHPTDC